MRVHYRDPRVTILHGDAGDLELEPESVDAILTDPPYGRAALPLWAMLSELAAHALRPGGWLLAYSGQAVLPEVMATLAAHLTYRWTLSTTYLGGEQLARIGDMSVLTGWKPVLAYRKRPFGSQRGARGRWQAGSSGRTGFRDVLPRGGREKDAHPWAQPLGEASELVARFTQPEQLIVDPFAGSGTFLVAAKALGRNALGAEIDERWCEAAAARCRQEALAWDQLELAAAAGV